MRDKGIFDDLPGCDGSHCGLTDLYPENEAALLTAIRGDAPFTTGWWSSKKEIATACITRDDYGDYVIEASVSDDFDTMGYGSALLYACDIVDRSAEDILGELRIAIYAAWERAEDDQKENRQYIGYSLIHDGGWCDTYIQPQCEGIFMDTPPGDNYSHWGWQEKANSEYAAPTKIRRRAMKYIRGTFLDLTGRTTIDLGDGWELKRWE